MKLGLEHHETLRRILVLTHFMWYFSTYRTYRTETPVVQVYISPFRFSTVKTRNKCLNVLHEQKHKKD
jgi:hypothetical protein